jgi:hypothetical protein
LPELLDEFVGRRSVADDPVDLFAVPVDDELGRGGVDAELLINRIPDLVAAAGAIEDEILGKELRELGVAVNLLNQQFAAPSATREKVEQDELVFFLGLGQRLVERSGHESRGGLGRSEGSDDQQAGEDGEFLHAGLLIGWTMLQGIISEKTYRAQLLLSLGIPLAFIHRNIRRGRAKGYQPAGHRRPSPLM